MDSIVTRKWEPKTFAESGKKVNMAGLKRVAITWITNWGKILRKCEHKATAGGKECMMTSGQLWTLPSGT